MIYPIIVAYNKFCGDSPTCEAVKKAGLNAVVCDNSTKDFGNKKYCEDNGFHYISMNGNKGLSKAYNKALDFLSVKEGYAVILDDDSVLPNDFFSDVQSVISSNSSPDLVLPVVLAGNVIISPCIKKGIRVRSPKSINELDINNITAINSGMIVSLKYFENYRYDENLFLDYIDHDFMDSFKNSKNKFVIADNIVINQNFFGMTVKDVKAKKVRYSLFKNDFIYYAKKHKKNMFLARLILINRRIKTFV